VNSFSKDNCCFKVIKRFKATFELVVGAKRDRSLALGLKIETKFNEHEISFKNLYHDNQS